MNFEQAVEHILKWEAGYVDDPDDKGGETNFGISKRSYPKLDIKNLDKDDAKEIYERDYWIPCSCDKLPGPIALLVFDTAVNMGKNRAIEILQESVGVNTDGIIGPNTLKSVQSIDVKDLAVEYCSRKMKVYTSLSGWVKYGFGWSRRLFDTFSVALD